MIELEDKVEWDELHWWEQEEAAQRAGKTLVVPEGETGVQEPEWYAGWSEGVD